MTSAAVRLSTLALRDFRNFERLDLSLPADGLAVVGENGQGKTNLLEAVYYLQLLRSVRGARDVDLVRFGAAGFHVEGAVARGARVAVGFERASRRKRVTVDGAPMPRLSDGIGSLPSVMFSPADVELVSGAPVVRRRYLDIVLALTSRPYLNALQTYRGALARRNAALRDAARTGRPDARVSVWDAPLAQAGGVLWTHRCAWVARAAGRYAELCAAIGEAGVATLRYASGLDGGSDPAAAIAAALEAKLALDVKRGMTQAGPHRDDLALTLDGRDLRTFGSAGQQRSAAIALRMLEWETLRDACGAAPLLLLDDPFAELDARRAARILALLSDAGIGQTLLTVPRDGDIPPEFTRLDRVRVEAGALRAWEAA
ncbi:MAG: DNA replication and repair protein RecF [Gemmatimonadota bacterium]|nr:DNA replication and repair protein RecF [Gemmatimonadota bacterium]